MVVALAIATAACRPSATARRAPADARDALAYLPATTDAVVGLRVARAPSWARAAFAEELAGLLTLQTAVTRCWPGLAAVEWLVVGGTAEGAVVAVIRARDAAHPRDCADRATSAWLDPRTLVVGPPAAVAEIAAGRTRGVPHPLLERLATEQTFWFAALGTRADDGFLPFPADVVSGSADVDERLRATIVLEAATEDEARQLETLLGLLDVAAETEVRGAELHVSIDADPAAVGAFLRRVRVRGPDEERFLVTDARIGPIQADERLDLARLRALFPGERIEPAGEPSGEGQDDHLEAFWIGDGVDLIRVHLGPDGRPFAVYVFDVRYRTAIGARAGLPLGRVRRLATTLRCRRIDAEEPYTACYRPGEPRIFYTDGEYLLWRREPPL